MSSYTISKAFFKRAEHERRRRLAELIADEKERRDEEWLAALTRLEEILPEPAFPKFLDVQNLDSDQVEALVGALRDAAYVVHVDYLRNQCYEYIEIHAIEMK